jgi:hypothetical protein
LRLTNRSKRSAAVGLFVSIACLHLPQRAASESNVDAALHAKRTLRRNVRFNAREHQRIVVVSNQSGSNQMATKKKAAQPKYMSLDAAIALEGLTRKQIGELQHDHGLKIYSVSDTLMVIEDELHAAIGRAAVEVKLR